MKRKIISIKNIPLALPGWQTIVVYLLYQELQISDIVLGVIIVLMAIWWIASIAQIFLTTPVDIFKDSK